MTSQLVVTADEESFVVVARHISNLLDDGQGRTALADTAGSSFLSNCEQLIEEHKFDALLDSFTDNFDVLFAKASDSDLETCLNICAHLLPYLDEYAPEGFQKLSQALRAKSDDHPDLRLATLVQMFNVADDSQTQYKILLDAIAFAKASGQSTLLAPAIRAKLEAWISEWHLSHKEQQRLYMAAADLFRANKKRKALLKEAYKLTIRALSILEDVPSHELKDLKPVAAAAIAEFIRSPDVFNFDLLHAPVVKQLENDPQDGPLYDLLNIVVQGNLKGLREFVKEKSSAIESAGIVTSDLEAKARLMALLDLATSNSQVSFVVIKDRLQLSSLEEVEEWLVRAMGRKLIEGQMDQPKQQITVTKAAHRTFGPDSWSALEKQLAAWKGSVENMQGLMTKEPVSSLRPAVHA